MAGFSSQGNEYDVGIVFIKNSGLYAIPFFGTFCKIFEDAEYKNIPNYDACIKNFLNNDKIPNVVIKFVAEKYPLFLDRINEIMQTSYTLDELIRRYKYKNYNKPIISPASILYSSKVFSQIMVKEVRKEERKLEPQIEKVGRNDPCPCGSGKKYKKCCMLKQEQEEE
ncbi:SEC-C domain-containing protein [bacterium]|nr:SEC-C domain-containing protein [bacterium]